MKKFLVFLSVLGLFFGMRGIAEANLLFQASLRNGSYGGGTATDTMDPDHGGSPNVLGIVDSTDGVTFTSTEADGQSNALINWVIGGSRITFKQHGTISFWFKADRSAHVGGEIFGDNYGFDKFRNGQITFSGRALRIENGSGTGDDQVQLSWGSWHNNVWYSVFDAANRLEYDRWYNIGFTWGGLSYDFEIWVNGILHSAADLPQGVSFPWGREDSCCPSGINFGLGDNHERGYSGYDSAAGVMFRDIRIWDEYRSLGDTQPVGWPTSYGALFEDRSLLELMRQYRDKFLNKTFEGKLYAAFLYEMSEEALAVLLDNPELILEARYLIEPNSEAVVAALNGENAVIYNTDAIVAFLDAYAEKSPPDLGIFATLIKRKMLGKRAEDELFLGFRLE